MTCFIYKNKHPKISCIVIIYLSLLYIPSFGQKNDINFLIEKIQADYPGFATKTNSIDFKQFVGKTISENKSDTFKIMGIIVDFFKDRHLDLIRLKESTPTDTYICDKNKIKKIRQYFNTKIKKKRYEGYWLNDYNNCIMALKKVGPHKFIGYVSESRDSNLLFPGMAAYEFDSIAPNTFLTKFTSDYSGATFYIRSAFRNDSVLITGANGKWKKINAYKPPMINNLPIVSDKASARLLDSNNFLITIPISTGSNAEIVDSLVKTNYQLISRTKNLIIDIRQNMGGTVRTYLPLLPFIYSKPIEKINVAMYCSKDGIQRVKENIAAYIQKGNIDSSFLKDWQALVKMEEDSIGKFIWGPTDTLRFDSVMPYSRNVGIIINYANQSAAEMMLLDCMQSSKVTLFGEHTMGAVDYLDYYPIDLPSKKYQLKIAATKRIIPPGGSNLDYKGIYPDVPISDEEKNWVDFVKAYYEKH
jgi:hypothetical protein